jgi:hypothetical protein
VTRCMRSFVVALLGCVLACCLGCAEEHEFTTADGEPNNVVIGNGVAYASLGSAGIAVLVLATGDALPTIEPPSGAVHDLAIDGTRLFVLDANTGSLSVLDVSDPAATTVVSEAVTLPQSRFGGVDAADGLVVVSGGTSELTVLAYDSVGRLSLPITQARISAGQPDVALRRSGGMAFVSTHFENDIDGAEFGVTAIRIGLEGAHEVDRLGLVEAGFTPGNASPANFAIEAAVTDGDLLIAHGGGLALIDASDPGGALRRRSVLALDMHAVSVAAMGGFAYVVGSEPQPTLVIVDIARQQVVGSGALSGVPTGVAVDGDNVVVAAGPAGLLLLKR